MYILDITGTALTSELSLAAFIALCPGAMQKPVQSHFAVLGAN